MSSAAALPTLPTLLNMRRDVRDQNSTPRILVQQAFDTLAAYPSEPMFISLRDKSAVIEGTLDSAVALPLSGIPFAVKDNIDVAGLNTTAACPAFSREAQVSATVVKRLLDAGAILLGKTNLDQFATGLVGTRTPYGACSSVYGPHGKYISGGSSSGSAAAVARGVVAFALGTDTAGSGRVPAALNGLVGLKPSRGSLSTSGVVPACRSLDCVSIFARTVGDAEAVWRVAAEFDAADPYSRHLPDMPAPWLSAEAGFTVGVPARLTFLEPSDTANAEQSALFAKAVETITALGGNVVPIDFTPYETTAKLLYAGPWVAERYAAVGEFVNVTAAKGTPKQDGLDPTVTSIILGAAKHSAVDAFAGQYKLVELKRAIETQWRAHQLDLLMVPTIPRVPTHEQVAADPVGVNSQLGTYTNFTNLLDMCAIALPAGLRPSDGLPFGITLQAPAGNDGALLELGKRFRREVAAKPSLQERLTVPPRGCVLVAVVGAHLTGQPLNKQLVEAAAKLVATVRTAPCYRLYKLQQPAGALPKPALVRAAPGYVCPTGGIEVEVWAFPAPAFGGFVAGVAHPLAIGTLEIEGGILVKGFVCEAHEELPLAEEITALGSWRAYLRLKMASTS